MLNFTLPVAQQAAMLALQLGVIIFAARICGNIAEKLKMPSVLGELLAGIIIGPCLLGGIPLPFHGMENGLFGILSNVEVAGPNIAGEAIITNVTFQNYHSSLYAIASIGSVMLLFVSGLETDLRMFIRYSLAGTLIGIGGVLFSFIFGAGLGMILLDLDFMHPCTLFLGILSTATSVGITARILSEKKKIDTPEGVSTLAAAVIDDVLGIICLAVVTGLTAVEGQTDWNQIGMISLKCTGFWLLATVIGLIAAGSIAKLLKRLKNPVIYSIAAFGIALLAAGIFEQQGLAMIIGAYITGLSLSKTDIAFALQRSLHPLYNFLVPVFFVVMGMLVDISVFLNGKLLLTGLLFSILAIAAKVIGCALPALLMNFNIKGALRIGTGMVPRGEVALIIAGIGMTTLYQGKPILDKELFGVAIIMTLVTTLAAPPLLAWALNLKGKGVRREEKDFSVVHTPFLFHSHFLAEFILRRITDNLKKEGYMLSQFDPASGVMQIRRDNLSFALTIDGNKLEFESNPDEVPFIKTLMFETFVSLHLELENLKNITAPVDLQKELITQPAGKPSSIHLDKAIVKDAIIMDLQAGDKPGVFHEMLRALVKCGAVKDENVCFREIMQRESASTTCLSNGIALPHCRTDAVSRQLIAIGIKRQGYDFDSMDGDPTRIFVMCITPENSDEQHLKTLAAISGKLLNRQTMEKILNAVEPQEVYSAFKE